MTRPIVTLPIDVARIERLHPNHGAGATDIELPIPSGGRATIYVVLEDDRGGPSEPIVFYALGEPDTDDEATGIRIEALR